VQELPPPARRSGSLPWNPAWVGAALSGDDHVEVVWFDFTDPATWSATFAEAERIFLLRPAQLFRVRRDLLPALEAAAAGVLFPELPAREQARSCRQAGPFDPPAVPGLPRQLAWNWLRKEWP
jgi:hypothetical protein